MSNSIASVREGSRGTVQSTSAKPEGTSSVFASLPHYDLLTALAIIQTFPGLRILDFTPRYDTRGARYGASGLVHKSAFGGLIFKRFIVNPGVSIQAAYQAFISEMMVLEHPIFKRQPNIPSLLGATFDAHFSNGSLVHILPVLVFEEATNGNLEEFLSSDAGKKMHLSERLGLCRDIARALEVLHAFSVIHGDLKPQNVLIFPHKSGVIAKVIDFGGSCFGSTLSDQVKLGKTPGWVAPEWHDDPFGVSEAKKLDIYSFGKLCAWILFGTQFGFMAKRTFDFTENDINRLLVSKHNVHSSSRSKMRKAITSTLGHFFALSFQEYQARRTGSVEILSGLLEDAYCQCRLYKRQRANFIFRLQSCLRQVSNRFSSSRIEVYLRIWVSRFLRFLFLKKQAEFFAPGQVQVMFSIRFSKPLLFWSSILATIVCGFGMLIPLEISATNHGLPNWFKAVFGLALLLILIPSMFVAYRSSPDIRVHLNYMSKIFGLFGRRTHVVPNIPQLFPILNQLHFILRREVVKGLKQRANSACTSCKLDAQLQLALCYHTGFGTERDVNACENLLNDKKMKNKLRSLCNEVRHHDKMSRVPVSSSDQTSLKGADFLSGAASYDTSDSIPFGLIEEAIQFYRNEIQAKEALGLGLRSLTELLAGLGNIYMGIGLPTEAAKCYESALVNERKYDPRESRFRIFDGTRYQDTNFLATKWAEALAVQGDETGAIRTLSKIKTIFKNPNGKHFGGIRGHTTTNGREVVARRLLAMLLIRQKPTDLKLLLKLDLVNDFSDLVKIQGAHTIEAQRCLRNIVKLANKLCTMGQTKEAWSLYQRLLETIVNMGGSASNVDREVKYELMTLLARYPLQSPQESVRFQEQLFSELNPSEYELATSPLLASKAACLSQHNKMDAALLVVEEFLHRKIQVLGRNAIVGVATELTYSIASVDEHDLEKETELQEELIKMCKSVQNAQIQEVIIDTLFLMGMVATLDEFISQLKTLGELLKACGRIEDWLKVFWYAIFFLAHLGRAIDKETLLKESLTLCINQAEHISETFGSDSENSLAYQDLLAKVYAIYVGWISEVRLVDDVDLGLLEKSIEVHRTTNSFYNARGQERHRNKIDSLKQLAKILARAGRLSGKQSYIEEAERHFRNLLELQIEPQSSDSRLKIEVRVELARCLYAKDQLDSVELQSACEAAYDDAERTLPKTHPAMVFYTNQLGSAYTTIPSGSPLARRRVIDRLRKAYDIHMQYRWKQNLRPYHSWGLVQTLVIQADLSILESEPYRAIIFLRFAARIARETFPDGLYAPSAIRVRVVLMSRLIEHGGGSMMEAREIAESSLSFVEAVYGRTHPETLRIKQWYNRTME